MKLTGILLLALAMQVSARMSAQTVTFSGKKVPLQKVFAAVKSQTGFVFFYNETLLEESKPVTINVKEKPLVDFLNELFNDEPLKYVIENHAIIIGRKSVPVSDTIPRVTIAPIDVHGHVTDSLGNPLAGASVTVKGHTGASAVTDINGNFTLGGIGGDAILIISSVGYETQEVRLKGKSDVSLKMAPHVNTLLDVVVSKGYYSTSQRLNTGDVTRVSGEDIAKQPVSDPILALEGRVPGLYIQQTSGAPGSYASIMIRGQNSLGNGNDPLYIVDGVPFGSGSLTSTVIGGGILGLPSSSASNIGGQGMSPFNMLNPGDIESIEVLKDADATAIYGSRGANGVVLITTKKGKAGPTRLDIDVKSGAGGITRKIPLLNTPQYLAMRHEAFRNDGISPSSYDPDINGDWDTTRYTNWQKVMIGKAAPFLNAQVSVSGGSVNTHFLVSGNYNKQGVAFPGDYMDQKASAHFSLTHASTNQRFQLQLSAGYTKDNSNLPQIDPTGLIFLPPDAPALYDTYGNLNWQPIGGSASWSNPLRYTVQHASAISTNLNSNLQLTYKLLPGLQIVSHFGYTDAGMNQTIITPSTYWPPPINSNPNRRTNLFASTESGAWIIEPQLDYQRKLAKGQLHILIGSTFQETAGNSLAQKASGFASDALIFDPLAATSNLLRGKSSTLYHYSAIYSRINYDWDEKFLINITARRDGSSRFGPGKQFGNFGAIGIGWIFSKERFVENSLPFLSFGKLRGSYGTAGNDQIGDYQYLSAYTPTGISYQGLGGMIPTGLPNANFAWELDRKLEGGVELGFLKDRVLLTASYFRNRSGNQLILYALPYIAGFTYVTANFPATVQNTGLEITLNTVNIKTGSFTWNSSFNLTVPKNELVAFPGIENSSYAHFYAVGHSLSSRFLFHYTGVDPQTGLYTFASKDGSGILSNQDRTISQPITQQYYGGLQNSFNYKGIQLDVLIQFVKQTGSIFAFQSGMPGTPANQTPYVFNRWQVPGQQTNVQRFASGEAGGPMQQAFENFIASDATIVDASFIRVKSLSLSYQVPAAWQKKMHIQNARFSIGCQNLFTFTSYKGMDPENQGPLPPLRMITAGFQLSL